MNKLNSKIKMLKKLDYTKIYEINKLYADKNTLEMHQQKLKEILKNPTKEDLDKQVFNLVVKDNSINVILQDIITNSFEFEIDNKDIEDYKTRIIANMQKAYNQNKNENLLKQINDVNFINNLTNSSIKHDLVFSKLGELWDIEVTDQEVKNALDIYYKKTNLSIRDYINDKEKFDAIRMIIFNEKINNELIHRFHIKLNLPKPNNPEAQEKKN